MASFELVSRSASLPKAGKSVGEDSHFANSHTVGVADGVGGWSKSGVDAGEYARSLMRRSHEHSQRVRDPRRILWSAYRDSANIPGSATACVVSLEGNTLTGAVVGDCGYMVLRNSSPVFQSCAQVYSFNAPYQLGTGMNTPGDAQLHSTSVQAGDVLIVATDGLFDNMTAEEIQAASAAVDTRELAEHLSTAAYFNSVHPIRDSPFSREARKHGKNFRGGKQDDITLVVSRVTSSTASTPWARRAPAAPPPATRGGAARC